MSDHSDALGGRLPLADPTDLVGAQRDLFDKMTSAVVPWADDTGFHSTTDDGRFIGPFNPALLNPAMTSVSAELLLGEREAHVVKRAGPRSGDPRGGRRLAVGV
jgi:4-carboxymuconolactone decarboxylase